MNKHFKSLELHKILLMLSNHATSDECKQNALSIVPNTDFDYVKGEINKSNDAFMLSSKYGSPRFVSIVNTTPSLERARTGSSLSLRELLDIRNILTQNQSLIKWRSQSAKLDSELDYLFNALYTNKTLEKKISNSILSDEEISDNASSKLSLIRRKIVSTGNRIRDNLNKMVRSTSTQKFLQESIVTVRDGRFVLPVKAEHKSDIPGLVHDTSSSGSTLFIEPMNVVEANNDIRVLLGQEQAEIERIIAELSADCAEVADSITRGYKASIELELYFAKANLAAKMDATAPELSRDGVVKLKKARHPLINPKEVVPIDVEIGDKFDSLIITGPNTGGKTVSLKTVGLLTAMTMCGLLIPALNGSKVSIFDHILVDIGDEQSIEQSLSTFSSHMHKIIRIMEVVNDKSLVLLDELGSGTDPIEGAALAVSLLKEFKKKGCKLLATTHYQEIKIYALESEGVENACCEFDIKTLKPTYRLLIGVPGKSNAFDITTRLGMPAHIIENAKKHVDSESKRFESVVEELDKSRQEYEQLRKDLNKEHRKVGELRKKLEDERTKIDKEKDREIEKARATALRMVESIKIRSQNLMDELDEIRRNKDKENFSQSALAAKSGMRGKIDKMYDIANPIIKQRSDDYKLPRPLKIGDNIIIKNTGKEGTVLTLPDKSGSLYVQLGIMRSKMKQSDLRLSDDTKVKLNGRKIATKTMTSKSEREIKMELDIRGQTIEEGLIEVDRFIDSCVLSGVGSVTIIHGKGTGALRDAVHTHLKRHRNIKSHRLGVYGEGESGVTIAEIK
ncbi:MAG: endonuclease MutS2 [Clostridiales bacterium]|nr:endonuclease MutS2 [Clostridiales bacterium]